MSNKLRRAQDPGMSLDPLQYLPLELAELVVQSLEMRDRVYVLDHTSYLKTPAHTL
jgi:F-box/TPR repeat protein Pof3